jgi:hypothetical protein
VTQTSPVVLASGQIHRSGNTLSIELIEPDTNRLSSASSGLSRQRSPHPAATTGTQYSHAPTC